MRGEGWTPGGGEGGRTRVRGGDTGKEEKASVKTFSYITEFGWLFPSTEARRRNLIDTTWLRDFRRDIEALQAEIRKQTASVYKEQEGCHEDAAEGNSHSDVKRHVVCVHNEITGSHEDVASRESHNEIERLQCELRRHPAFVCRGERMRHKRNILSTECHSAECCVAMKGNETKRCNHDEVKCGERINVPAMFSSCRELSACSTEHLHALDSSEEAICNESGHGGESDCGGSDLGLKVKEERLSHYPNVGESSRSETCDLDSRLSTFRDDTAKCDVYSKMQRLEKRQGSASDEPCAGEESFLLNSSLTTYTNASVKCDAYSSMHSDVSRDSGVFTADDTSFLSEASGDTSLLQELGDVLSDQDMSLESCIHCGSLPLEEIRPGIKGNAGYTVWLTRFSSSNELSDGLEGSHEWEVREAGDNGLTTSCSFGSVSPIGLRRENYSGEENDNNVIVLEEKQVVKGKQCSACEKMNKGVKVSQCCACWKLIEDVSVKQCAVCKYLNEGVEMKQGIASDNRNESKDGQVKLCVTCKKLQQEPSSNHQPTQEISVMEKFCKSFQDINKRVEDLRSGLDSLTGEVNKSKHEFHNLEQRATKLLASTVSSRHRLTRVRALQLLEDRLQEEWLAAYDPESVNFHENYIV